MESFGSKINIWYNGKSLKEPVTFRFYGNAGLWDKKLPYSLEFAQIKAPLPPTPVSLEV